MAINSVSTAQEFIRDIAGITSDSSGRQAHAFSRRENEAFEWAEIEAVRHLKDAGLVSNRDYRIDKDAIGNLLVTVYGADRSKTVMSGSHLDSVRNGGKHDGVDGVASAIAYLESFAKSHKKGSNYTFVVFRAEESSPMTGEACLGSKVMTGMIPENRLQSVTYGLEQQNRVLLKEVFGPETWDRILTEREEPWVRQGTLYLPSRHDLNGRGGSHDMEVLGYNELHIEQSNVLYKKGFHAGIASHIGGSTNRRFQLDSSHLPAVKKETFNSPRRIWNLTFIGKEAHTGGMPHNATENRSDAEWHRQDALIGTCAFLRELLLRTRCDLDVSSMSIPKETGFTTVPAIQHVTLHAPAENAEEVFVSIQSIARKICDEKELSFNVTQSVESSVPLPSLDHSHLLRHIGIPLIVEKQARLAAWKVHSIFGGEVRATATDARMDECGLRMNLNTRDVNPQKRDEMLRAIEDEIRKSGIDADTLFSAKAAVTEHVPLDADMIRVAEEEAWALSQRTLTMPLQPGHDAGCMQKAGVATGMVIENHPGPSHIATEIVGDDEQADAITLQHSILDRYTGIGPKPSGKTRMLRQSHLRKDA